MGQPQAQSICFFNTNKAWGGGEKWHLEAANYFHSQGYRVLIIAHSKSELFQRAKSCNIPCYSFSVSNIGFLNPILLFQLKQLFQKEHIGTLFLNLSADLKAAGIAGHLAGVPKMIYRRGLDKKIKPSLLNRWLLTRAIHQILTNSQATKNSVLSHFSQQMPESKVKIVYNGISPEQYESQPSTSPIPKPTGKVVIGNLGRLSLQKGQTYLIQAASILKSKELPFQIWIAGSGELENELKEDVRNRGLEEEVKFLGFQKEVRGFLEAIDLFAFPSLWEGFGYVLAEAGYFEKAVVAFDASSTPEVVTDGETGYLVPAKKVEALAEKLEELILSAHTRAKLGKAAKARILENFTFQQAMKQVETLLYKD